jgi:hypothetical protein
MILTWRQVEKELTFSLAFFISDVTKFAMSEETM